MELKKNKKGVVDYNLYSKEELKEMGEDGRKILREFLVKECELWELKSSLKFICENLEIIIDKMENNSKEENYKYSIVFLSEFSNRKSK